MRYRLFGPTGLRVSEICLGAMSFGEEWGFGADEPTSHAVLDAFADAGGTFIDTANFYHRGETEEYLGRWLDSSRRHRTVMATKYTLSMDHSDPNASGNHRKSLVRAVEGSLKRLRTDYIDLLWIHAWDQQTPMAETLRALDDLVRAGKVLYIGASDTPAWVVSGANVRAELMGWSAFAGLQVEYGLLQRTPERDLLPMAAHHGLSTVAWGPMGGGVLTGKYTRGGNLDSKRASGNEARGRTDERSLTIARAVDSVADELGVSSAQVAVAWVMRRYGVIPIVGARKVSQIRDTLGAVDVTLTDEHVARLDEVSAVPLGFPHDFLATDGVQDVVLGEHVRPLLDKRPIAER